MIKKTIWGIFLHLVFLYESVKTYNCNDLPSIEHFLLTINGHRSHTRYSKLDEIYKDTVYKGCKNCCFCFPSMKTVALKYEENFFLAKNEISTLCQFKDNKYIHQLIEWYYDEISVVIVTELALYDVFTYLKYNHVDLQTRLYIIKSVINAVVAIHQKDFVHMDLKWENFFVFDHDAKVVKLADFGFSQKGCKIDAPRGTLSTIAPEIESFKMICDGKAADIFSLGKMIHHILSLNQAGKYFESLIDTNPQNRPSAQDVLDEFDDIAFKILHQKVRRV
jgi:serine/threonine protein kinase